MLTKKLIFTLALLLTVPVSATVIYKWVDKKGVTHYSQQIPQENVATTEPTKLLSEDIEPQPIGFIAPKARTTASPMLSQAWQDAALIKKQDKKQAKAICSRAKHNLNLLTTHSRIRSADKESGKVTALTEEARQARIKTQQTRVKLFCS